MSTRTKWSFYRAFTLGWILMLVSGVALAQSVQLYTPYTKISVPPGESIDYTVEVVNFSHAIRDVGISVTGLPKDWDYSLQSGGWTIEQLAVKPDEEKSFKLQVQVPLKIEKGKYTFYVNAAGYSRLPLTVLVSEKGTFKTDFHCDQPNMQGHATSSFTFNTELKNHTVEPQIYSLRSQAPRGWRVIFKPNHKQATSVNVDPNGSKNVSIEITAPTGIKEGTYSIPVQAVNSNTSADLDLEVVITGSYEMELTTPTGLLSTKLTAGETKRIELLVKNTGSTTLKDVELSATNPSKWEVQFDPKEIEAIEAGQSKTVYATLQAYDKAIAGDYVVKMKAKSPEVDSDASFRVSVKTSWWSGALGIVIILAVIGGLGYLFKKYGRR
ncbi:COG1470 family protein [Reichenbachiella ulvae]|uniref:NEW3 domain-containing protein n=1 Tax=Reichenbachiella ulvae TaxID=2980104 RepID=A0ABT3CPX3_9BACT|nr:NEW3 domain-containing protein [Reichenbachiella ulvae]MCV9385765.1 NEW3 domain-containing protein [Reichenbachiella ulvae]